MMGSSYYVQPICKFIFVSILIFSKVLLGQENPTPWSERYHDFGIVYGAQWVIYGITQHDVIKNHGRFSNMLEYPWKAHFDDDGFDYNVFKHALSGQYYFLFFRYRGYDRRDAFIGTFVSSLIFEFAVETYTERPSYQDMYQTPVFGTLLGIGSEKLSDWLLTFDNFLVRSFGYVLNPFKLLPGQKQKVSIYPSFTENKLGLTLTVDY